MKKILLLTTTFIILTLSGCIEQVLMSSLLFDLDSAEYEIKFGINIDESNYGEQLQEMNEMYQEQGIHFSNLHTFESEDKNEYGYIYEISDKKQRTDFFLDRKAFSYTSSKIVFIYEIDYYVLEVYHETDSVFPGFLSTYEFEANYQYDFFYKNDLTHPFVSKLIKDIEAEVTWYLKADLIHNHTLFNNQNIPMIKVASFDLDQSHIVLIYCENESDTEAIYINQEAYYEALEDYTTLIVKYQNLVFRIQVETTKQTSFIETYFDDITFESYQIVE